MIATWEVAVDTDHWSIEPFRVFDGSLDNIYVLRCIRSESGIVDDFVIEYANPRAIDVGGRPMTDLVGQQFSDAYPEALDIGLDEIFRKVLQSGVPYEDDDFNFSAKVDGVHSSGWFHMQATRFEDSVIVAFRDVTAQRQRERQWADERTEAQAIQRAFLPSEMPRLPGLEVAAAYMPASDARLGGDWFDAFLVDEAVVMIVGDVAGHGIHSAAVMGQLRNAARAYAHEAPIPEDIVSRLNRMLCRLQPDELASMIVAVWDPVSGMLRHCNGGHPPMLRCRNGETDFLGSVGGPMLGADSTFVYLSAKKLLRFGTTVLLYSDGLVESRSESLDEGLTALRAKADSMCDLTPQEICNELLNWRVRGEFLEDDMCVLAARLG
jgi:Stage II sporulation protein E (SpoIIE)/PAS fold